MTDPSDPDAPIPYRYIEHDYDGEPIYRREMTAEEIEERIELNFAQTTERQRRWALENGLWDGEEHDAREWEKHHR